MLDTPPFLVLAPVQSDKTGPAIVALRDDIAAFGAGKGITAVELERTINGRIRELPGSFEDGDGLLAGMQQNALLGRPDDYYATLPARYRAMTAAELDSAAKVIDPKRLVWVVVGDAALVRPQLDAVGLPVELLKPAASPAG